MVAQVELNGVAWPVADGADQQILVTDGAGQLTWTDPASRTVTDQLVGPLTAGTYYYAEYAFADHLTGLAVRSRSGTGTFQLLHNGTPVADTTINDTPTVVPLDVDIADGDQLRLRVLNPASLDSLLLSLRYGP